MRDDYESYIVKKLKPSGIREFFDYAKDNKDVISLGVGAPDLPVPKEIIDASIKALKEGHTSYTSNQGLKEARAAVSKYLKERFNLDYDASEIILTSGSSQAIFFSLRAILNPGDEVIVTDPTYVCYVPDIEMCGAKAIIMPTKEENDFKITKEDLEKYITPKTKALLLCYPNNPTGAIMTYEDYEAIVPTIIKHDLMVVSDEIYSELTYGDKRHVSIASLPNMYERTIVINGFSKSFSMTGFRIGFACCKGDLVKQVLKVHQFLSMSAPTMTQYALIEAVNSCYYHIEDMRNTYDERRKYLLDNFKRLNIPCSEAKGAFYLFPNITKYGLSSRDFCLELLFKHNILVVPGTAFGDAGEGYIRVSYVTNMNNLKKFIEELEKLEHK